MFDKLIELIEWLGQALIFIAIVDPYEGGIHLRMGRFLRELKPGNFYFKLPCHIDRVITEHVVPRTERITGLATTTKDGRAIGFDAVVTWRIHDLKKSLLEVSDLTDAIADSCAGILGTELSNRTWDDIVHGNIVDDISTACRKNGFKWGVEVIRVQLTGVAAVKNFRVALQSGSTAPQTHITVT